MLEPGITGCRSTAVIPSNTARAVGSGTLEVFATPAMVALVEQTAMESVAGALDPGWGTVGTLVQMQHLAPTPLGGTVTARTELTQVDRRRLVFSVEVSDEAGVVGRGTHERFLVEEQSFLARAKARTR